MRQWRLFPLERPEMNNTLRFHVRVYPRPAAVTTAEACKVGHLPITPLVAAQADLLSLWPITFEEAAQRLAQLPRMFLEPDGSFVWTGQAGAWQIDGMLYDRGPHLAYVELRGRCGWSQLQELLGALNPSAMPLVYEQIAEGLLLDEADFCTVAAASSGGK